MPVHPPEAKPKSKSFKWTVDDPGFSEKRPRARPSAHSRSHSLSFTLPANQKKCHAQWSTFYKGELKKNPGTKPKEKRWTILSWSAQSRIARFFSRVSWLPRKRWQQWVWLNHLAEDTPEEALKVLFRRILEKQSYLELRMSDWNARFLDVLGKVFADHPTITIKQVHILSDAKASSMALLRLFDTIKVSEEICFHGPELPSSFYRAIAEKNPGVRIIFNRKIISD